MIETLLTLWATFSPNVQGNVFDCQKMPSAQPLSPDFIHCGLFGDYWEGWENCDELCEKTSNGRDSHKLCFWRQPGSLIGSAWLALSLLSHKSTRPPVTAPEFVLRSGFWMARFSTPYCDPSCGQPLLQLAACGCTTRHQLSVAPANSNLLFFSPFSSQCETAQLRLNWGWMGSRLKGSLVINQLSLSPWSWVP